MWFLQVRASWAVAGRVAEADPNEDVLQVVLVVKLVVVIVELLIGRVFVRWLRVWVELGMVLVEQLLLQTVVEEWSVEHAEVEWSGL